jgi:hypothetical protein
MLVDATTPSSCGALHPTARALLLSTLLNGARASLAQGRWEQCVRCCSVALTHALQHGDDAAAAKALYWRACGREAEGTRAGLTGATRDAGKASALAPADPLARQLAARTRRRADAATLREQRQCAAMFSGSQALYADAPDDGSREEGQQQKRVRDGAWTTRIKRFRAAAYLVIIARLLWQLHAVRMHALRARR